MDSFCGVFFLILHWVTFLAFCLQCKLGIVKFIEAEQVPEVETVIHLVVASSDTRHSVATAADLELKSKQRWGSLWWDVKWKHEVLK